MTKRSLTISYLQLPQDKNATAIKFGVPHYLNMVPFIEGMMPFPNSIFACLQNKLVEWMYDNQIFYQKILKDIH